jgi:hypothetical protein
MPEQPESSKAFPARIAELTAEAASLREEVKRLGEKSHGIEERDPVSGAVVSWTPDHPTDAEISELAQRLKTFVPTLQAALLAYETTSPFIRPIREQIQHLPLVASLIDMMVFFFNPVGLNSSLSGTWPSAVHNLTTIIGLLKNAPALDTKNGETRNAEVSPPAVPRRADGTGHRASQPEIQPSRGQRSAARERIDIFISDMNDAGYKITRKDIWTVAGYKDPTEFERFQREDSRTTRRATSSFDRVLQKTPEKFMAALKKRPAAD